MRCSFGLEYIYIVTDRISRTWPGGVGHFDHGSAGIEQFLKEHKCNIICKSIGLSVPSGKKGLHCDCMCCLYQPQCIYSSAITTESFHLNPKQCLHSQPSIFVILSLHFYMPCTTYNWQFISLDHGCTWSNYSLIFRYEYTMSP